MRRAGALAIATAAAAVLVARARGGEPPVPDVAADGFDHISHQSRVEASAVAQPPCSRCHTIDARGRLIGSPGHAACFGDCHGGTPRAAGRGYTIEAAREPMCRACHRPAELARLTRTGARPAARPPPPHAGGVEGEFALTLSHAAHAGVARGCRTCHATPPEPGRPAAAVRGSGHPRCAGCHATGAGGAVAMADCAACHRSAVGPTRAPLATPGAFPVTAVFSHQAHLRRMRTERDACASCHGGVATAAGVDLPTPKKPDCARCHDGRAAFSMTETACRRCHVPPSRVVPATELVQHVATQRVTFSHASHASTACTSCHAVGAAGEPGPIGRGHAPCADSGCHATDFAALEPVTCTACHVRGEPWRDLHVDPQPAGPSDFGVAFSHRRHLSGSPPPLDAPCTTCHLERQDGHFAPAPGHAACSGAGCHAPARGPAPTLGDCARCHERGLAADGPRSRVSRWSVRARFTHVPHRTEPGDPARPVACTGCHTSLLEAGAGEVRAPPKKTCARCHDGGAAFKLTGHGCARCHSRGSRVRTATGSR